MTVANTSLNQLKKKNTAAQIETRYCLLFFRAHNVVTISYNNSIISYRLSCFKPGHAKIDFY